MGIGFISGEVASEEARQAALTAAWQTLFRFHVEVPGQTDLFTYFKMLDQVLTRLAESGEIEPVEAVMRHIDYLADKAGCHTSAVLGGGRFTTHPQIVADALVNISTILQQAVGNRPEHPPEGIPADVFTLILEAEAKLAGWCSRERR